MGRIKHTKAMREALDEELKHWAEERSAILKIAAPEARAAAVRARLMLNVVRGEDKGVASCKLLGQDREVGIFGADTQQTTFNTLVASLPAEWRERYLTQGQAAEERDKISE